MLGLSRRVGQRVHLKTGKTKITIEVTKIRSGEVRFGIDAPPEVEIVRDNVKRIHPRQTDRNVQDG